MLIRTVLIVIITFFIADVSYANTIRTFSYNIHFDSDTQGYAEDKVAGLNSSRRIYEGNIVYVKIKQNIGPNAYFRFYSAGGGLDC